MYEARSKPGIEPDEVHIEIQVADDLKKYGGYVPGIRPGKPTADFLRNSMTKITLAGAVFLTVIALIPMWMYNQLGIDYMVASFFGGTSMLIVVGVMLGKLALRRPEARASDGLGAILHEALLGRSVLLLVGALVIGFLSGARGLEATSAFFVAPSQGILALFPLEMGMVAARRFADLRRAGLFLLGFGVVMPVLHGVLGLMLGRFVGLGLGGATLLGVLAASASYIAAPAAVRMSLPEANPTLYLTSSLAITFPFNVTLGVPLYFAVGRWLFGGSS